MENPWDSIGEEAYRPLGGGGPDLHGTTLWRPLPFQTMSVIAFVWYRTALWIHSAASFSPLA